MIFRKICNDTSTMSATELAHNFVFVKNREAWYRDFDREIPVRDLMREICAKHAAPADTDELTDEELDEILTITCSLAQTTLRAYLHYCMWLFTE